MSAKKAAIGAIGLGAATSLLLAPGADAATEAMQLAAGDNRFGIITTIVLIALGWCACSGGTCCMPSEQPKRGRRSQLLLRCFS